MNFPSPEQSRVVEKTLGRQARIELAHLRRLLKHASTWLSMFDGEGDRMRVVNAAMEDAGAKHVQFISAEIRVLPQSGMPTYHVAFGFRVFDGSSAIFIGARGERDMELSIKRSVAKEYPNEPFERTSTWEPEADRTGYDDRANPRNWGIGQRLVDEGVSLVNVRALANATPSPVAPRKGPRL